MDFYNRGGGIGIGIRNLEHQTLSPEPLHLSLQEQRAVIAFLPRAYRYRTAYSPRQQPSRVGKILKEMEGSYLAEEHC